jgi:hypothetical protein
MVPAQRKKIEHIERQIKELSPPEFAELRNWVLDQDWQAWDEQIERDLAAGKLDKLIAEADDDFKSGRSREI